MVFGVLVGGQKFDDAIRNASTDSDVKTSDSYLRSNEQDIKRAWVRRRMRGEKNRQQLEQVMSIGDEESEANVESVELETRTHGTTTPRGFLKERQKAERLEAKGRKGRSETRRYATGAAWCLRGSGILLAAVGAEEAWWSPQEGDAVANTLRCASKGGRCRCPQCETDSIGAAAAGSTP